MEKHSRTPKIGKKLPAKQPSKTCGDRIREAREREARFYKAAIRLAGALGLPVAVGSNDRID